MKCQYLATIKSHSVKNVVPPQQKRLTRTTHSSNTQSTLHLQLRATWLSVTPSVLCMYIVFFFRENWVPGISMEQENMVSRDKEDKGITPFTVTSYVIPLWTVVVVMSIFGGLKTLHVEIFSFLCLCFF